MTTDLQGCEVLLRVELLGEITDRGLSSTCITHAKASITEFLELGLFVLQGIASPYDCRPKCQKDWEASPKAQQQLILNRA